MNADLVEVEEPVEQPDVPVRGAARADVRKYAAVLARQIARAERRDRARAHVGQAGGIDHRQRHARRGIEQRQQPHFGRQAERIVVDVVADDLHARQRERCDVTAQHVEMPMNRRAGRVAAGHQVHARLDHRAAVALRAQSALDGCRISSSVSCSAATSGAFR